MNKFLSAAMLFVPILCLSLQSGQANAVEIDLDMFPDGSPVPVNAVLTDQYREIGVLIDGRRPGQEPGSLFVISARSSNGNRYLFFNPDIDGAIAIFRFVVPGSDIPTAARLFRATAGWQVGESITLVAFDQDGEQIDQQFFPSPAPDMNYLAGDVELTGSFHMIEMRTDGNPGIGFRLVEFLLDDADSDGDGVSDLVDNCSNVENANQRDTDADGIGNICDPDVAMSDDCIVNFLDLNVYKENFFRPGDFDTDNDGDGQTNFVDLNVVMDFFFGPPGPSASGCN